MNRNPHILNAATNLLGICFIVIGGLKITDMNSRTLADEVAWLAAFLLLLSTLLSYFSIRNLGARKWQEAVADRCFIVGVFVLMLSVFVFAVGL